MMMKRSEEFQQVNQLISKGQFKETLDRLEKLEKEGVLATLDQLPASTREKLRKYDILDFLDIFPRNLGVFFVHSVSLTPRKKSMPLYTIDEINPLEVTSKVTPRFPIFT
ncbi:MAG: hypothetical protein ACXADY_09030 [Candidatus Hodarchaeales archaeon]|jgi:hypothetical protein